MTRIFLAGLTTMLASACAGDGLKDESTVPSEKVFVLPLADLSEIEPSDDPLAPHRPGDVDCSSLTGWYVEDDHLEVSTASCNYLALTEPSAADADAGEILRGQLSHFDLTAPEPARAHIALTLGVDLLWETSIEIPMEANVIDLQIPLPRPIETGELFGIHLHNHGQNTWNLSRMYVERAPE